MQENYGHVSFRELIESREFKEVDSKLSFVVGKDPEGNNIVSDLAKMAGLIVAGNNNAEVLGFINSLLLSFMYEATPEEIRLVLLDSEKQDLLAYEGNPFLLTPVVSDPKIGLEVLKKVIKETDYRYDLFAKNAVRLLDHYNKRVDEGYATADNDNEEAKKLPRIVVILRGIEDLLKYDIKNTLNYLVAILQLSRGAGIHVVIVPKILDVIAGPIKENIINKGQSLFLCDTPAVCLAA